MYPIIPLVLSFSGTLLEVVFKANLWYNKHMEQGSESIVTFNREVLADETTAHRYGDKIDTAIQDALIQRGHQERIQTSSAIHLINDGFFLPNQTYRQLLRHPFDAVTYAASIHDVAPSSEDSQKTHLSSFIRLSTVGGIAHGDIASKPGAQTVQYVANGRKSPKKNLTGEQYDSIMEDIRQQTELGASNSNHFRPGDDIMDEIIATADHTTVDRLAYFTDDTEHNTTYIVGQTNEYETKLVRGRIKRVAILSGYSIQVAAKGIHGDDGVLYDLGLSYSHTISRGKPALPSYKINGAIRSFDPVTARAKQREHLATYTDRYQGENFAKLAEGVLKNLRRLTDEDSSAFRTG